MAVLFFIMCAASVLWILFNNPAGVLSIMLVASSSGVELVISLVAIYIVWMGIVQIAIDAGVISGLARLLSPIIDWLFGTTTDEVRQLIATNISANMIGAGGAATPAAISAIEKMSTPDMTRATDPMIMLFILSATSLQILPTTVIGILEKYGSTNAHTVILPTIIVSAATTLVGIILAKLFTRINKKRGNK